jgi:hypothetical protein
VWSVNYVSTSVQQTLSIGKQVKSVLSKISVSTALLACGAVSWMTVFKYLENVQVEKWRRLAMLKLFLGFSIKSVGDTEKSGLKLVKNGPETYLQYQKNVGDVFIDF